MATEFEYIMVTDSAWDTDYRVVAKTPLHAAKIVAQYINRPLDDVKRLYRPIVLDDIQEISEGSTRRP